LTGFAKTTPAGTDRRVAVRILLSAGLILVGALSASMVLADETTPPPVPANIEAPAGHRAFLMTHAVGTQNYICLGAGLPWTFIGPQATVFDGEGEQALTHFLSINPDENVVARATWQHRDTSAVWAAAVASSSDPEFVAPGAVAWLLLSVVGAEAGPTGGDRIAATSFIQRVNTAGGIAPVGGCPAVGARAFVPYTADYVFYRAR
jgi:hypothetical protein